MTFALCELPYPIDALEPHISRETLEFHHGKHHKAYLDKANELLPGSGLEGLPLEQAIVKAKQNPAQGVLFNQLGQDYNHTLFWHSMSPNGGGSDVPGALAGAINESFGDFGAFRAKFVEAGMTQFGSGWCWLVMNENGSLEVTKTANAETPLTEGKTPLLVCDVWEHSYYIDYRNARPKYLEVFMDHLVNWENAAKLFENGPLKLAA